MRVFKRLLISSLIGLTGFGTVQADLTAHRINATPVDLSAAATKSVEPGIYIVQMDDRPVIAYEGSGANNAISRCSPLANMLINITFAAISGIKKAVLTVLNCFCQK